MKQIIKSVIGKFGYQIRKNETRYDPFLGYDLEAEANEQIKIIRPYTMLTRTRLITLYQNAVFCEQIDMQGSFVECGVWKGGSVALMALANLKYGKKRRDIHLFDSFQEICEPEESTDGARAVKEVKKWSQGETKGRLIPLVGIYDSFGGPGTLEGNKQLLEDIIGYNPDYLHYHHGWFQDTLPKEADQIAEIAILRLDGDWYASTNICLEFLYEKVVRGGFIIVDDYNTYDGCKKAVDEFRHQQNIVAYLHHIDADGRYWIKP